MNTDRATAGAESKLYHGRIDEDAVAAFALATNDPRDLYQSGAAVPPLFTAAVLRESNWGEQRAGHSRVRSLIRRAHGSVHGEHDVHFRGPVKTGMALQWKFTLPYSARQTRGGVLVAQRILLSDSTGTPVVEHLWSTFYIGGTIAADVGPALPSHTFPEEARSRPIGQASVHVDRDQAFRYAGISGDHAGHAMDDEIARREGYPSKILQGMCTFGLCSGLLVDLAAGGDPGQLRRLACRFSAPAFPLQDLTVHLYDAGRTHDGGRALVFEASQKDRTVIKHGRVELLPD
jgi:acyl dehydratase